MNTYRYNKNIEIFPKVEKNAVTFSMDLINNYDKEIRIIILNFIKTVTLNDENINLSFFFSNLKSLTFREINNLSFFYKYVDAYYDYKTNTIYYKKEHKDAISHELWHVAGKVSKNKIIYSGLEQISPGFIFKKRIGTGINEGVVSLLDEKYFNKTSGYSSEIALATNINRIVDAKLSKFYSEADLLGLVKELEIYSSCKDSLEFIDKLDFINFHGTIYNPKAHLESALLFWECLLYTFRCYILKLVRTCEKGILTQEEAQNLFNSMVLSSPESIANIEGFLDIPYINKFKRHIPEINHLSVRDKKRMRLHI